MAFNNTKTPVKPTDGKGQRYHLTPVGPLGRLEMSPEVEEAFRRLFPIRLNVDLMRMFGMSHSTLHRYARQFGLKKNRATILRLHAAQIKKICTNNGYYESIKGKAPSQAAIEGTRRLRATGWNPITALKRKNRRKYKKLMEQKREDRKALIARERRRYRLGMEPLSNLMTKQYADTQYTKQQICCRHYAKKHGYIVGDPAPESGERTAIYYTEQTTRRPRFEQNAERYGMMVHPITMRRYYNGKNL